MKKLVIGTVLAAMAVLAMGCEVGEAVEVASCSQCRTDEKCVTASGKLYCSNLCVDPTVICAYGCDAMAAAEYSHTLYWVCAPKAYYQAIPTGKATYHKMDGDCNTAVEPNKCSPGEYCLKDTQYPIYFCSDACSNNSDCALGCCATNTSGGQRCAPADYCW
jgi:hypothetical protein